MSAPMARKWRRLSIRYWRWTSKTARSANSATRPAALAIAPVFLILPNSGRYVIVRATYALTPEGEPRIQYADLKKHFAGWEKTPTLADTREAVRRIRASKGMLITPGDEDCRSAGSFFKNPILSRAGHEELARRAAARGMQVPVYPALEAHEKSFRRMAGRALGICARLHHRTRRHLAQTRAGDREPGRCDGGGDCGSEGARSSSEWKRSGASGCSPSRCLWASRVMWLGGRGRLARDCRFQLRTSKISWFRFVPLLRVAGGPPAATLPGQNISEQIGHNGGLLCLRANE